MNLLLVILVCCMCGCAVVPKPTTVAAVPLPPKIVARNAGIVARKAVSVASKTPAIQLHLIYPPDATNYVWALEMSTNLIVWTPLATGLVGAPAGTSDVPGHLPQAYFRAHGEHL